MNVLSHLPSSEMCCGCAACSGVCSFSAIQMLANAEGFLHPVVDGEKCVGCRACEHACPVLSERQPTKPLQTFAARAKSADLRLVSSSGGLFTLLARQVLARQGTVFGVKCRLADGEVVFSEACNEVELAEFRGSKYVQAAVGNIYSEVESRLESRRMVLFSGTPCQVAGLKAYLGRDYDQLITIDFVCHGVPSPYAWRRFLAQHGRRNFKEVLFRDKRYGWRKYAMSVKDERGRKRCGNLRGFTFLWGFIADLYNRSSCYHCAFRDGRNASDITLGDCWGVEEIAPMLDDNTGISVILTHTAIGDSLLEEIRDELELVSTNWDRVASGNPSLIVDVKPHPRRAAFFAALERGEAFDRIIRRELGMSVWRRVWRGALRRFKR